MESLMISLTKRCFDLVLGVLFLLIATPFVIMIAVAIKLTSSGPILYKQKRIGVISSRSLTLFDVYKFRTMKMDAEKETGAVLSRKDDPRTTPIGRFLRKTRLDELPQFLNVIKGDMSIVGPRPERPELMTTLSRDIPFFEERTRFVKPGITGLAQVSLSYGGHLREESGLHSLISCPEAAGDPDKAREAEGMRIKFLYDMLYSSALERFTSFLITDLSIMLKTPLVMFVYRTGQ